MTDASQRDLTAHEVRYIEQLRMALTDLSRGPRKVLLAAATQNLAERPATASWNELLKQLGRPDEYAAGLRSDLENTESGTVERSRRRQRAKRTIVAGSVVILVVVATLGFWRWQTWQADFTANSSAVCVGPDDPQHCDETGITDQSNTFGDVREVICTPGTKVTLVNGIVSPTPVTITGVDVGPAGGAESVLRLDDVVPWPMRQLEPDLHGHPYPGSWPIAIGPETGETLLRFHLTLQCGSWMQAGGSTTLIDFRVHYRAWGKDRVETMSFNQALQIKGPDPS